jgi:hypothetical protein
VTASVKYQHSQRSPLVLLLFCGAGAVAVASLALADVRALPLGPRPTIAAGALALFGSGLVFSSLKITVDDERLAWHFGGGLFRKSVLLAEIVSAAIARRSDEARRPRGRRPCT